MRRSKVASRFGTIMVFSVICLGLTAPGCSPPAEVGDAPQQPRDVEADRTAVIEAHEKLIRAYESGDAEAFTALLRPADDSLIFHPRLENRFDGIAEARQNLGRMFGRLTSSTWSEVHQSVSVVGDVAWLTCHVVVESPGIDQPFVGRGTEVWVRDQAGWKLAHGHWSPQPGAGP